MSHNVANFWLKHNRLDFASLLFGATFLALSPLLAVFWPIFYCPIHVLDIVQTTKSFLSII